MHIKQNILSLILIIQIISVPSFAGRVDAFPVIMGLAAVLLSSGENIGNRGF